MACNLLLDCPHTLRYVNRYQFSAGKMIKYFRYNLTKFSNDWLKMTFTDQTSYLRVLVLTLFYEGKSYYTFVLSPKYTESLKKEW